MGIVVERLFENTVAVYQQDEGGVSLVVLNIEDIAKIANIMLPGAVVKLNEEVSERVTCLQ